MSNTNERYELIAELRWDARIDSLFGDDVRKHRSNRAADMLEADGKVQQVAVPQAMEDLAGVVVCCGDFVKCHRPCTPRGQWIATKAYAVSVPDGYTLVPIEPTPEMIAAAEGVEDLYKRGTPDTWAKVYHAMIQEV